MSAQRARGTAWETAIVDYLRASGFPHAERRASNGVRDRGDIAGIPGVVVEAKSVGRLDLATFLGEAETERANAGAAYGIVWAKRKGKTSAAHGYVVMDGAAFTALLRAAGYGEGASR